MPCTALSGEEKEAGKWNELLSMEGHTVGYHKIGISIDWEMYLEMYWGIKSGGLIS